MGGGVEDVDKYWDEPCPDFEIDAEVIRFAEVRMPIDPTPMRSFASRRLECPLILHPYIAKPYEEYETEDFDTQLATDKSYTMTQFDLYQITEEQQGQQVYIPAPIAPPDRSSLQASSSAWAVPKTFNIAGALDLCCIYQLIAFRKTAT